MRSFIKAALFASVLLLGVPLAHAQISIGVGISIGHPPPLRVIRVLPPSPGPGFFWVAGYWYPEGRRYVWHPGYWTRPPYPGARWIEPRYDGRQYFMGYWDGPRGRVAHDFRWDHERDRDYDRWRPENDHSDRGNHGDHGDRGDRGDRGRHRGEDHGHNDH